MLTIIRVDGFEAFNDNSHKTIESCQATSNSFQIQPVHIDTIYRNDTIAFAQLPVTPGGSTFNYRRNDVP